jgi:hypothetical protein
MKARAALVLVVLMVAGSLSTMFAKASHQNVKDGDDVKGMLDVRRVENFGKPVNPRWKILTIGGSTAKELWDHGFFLVYLDTFGDSRFDYYALVASKGSKMKGTLWRDPANKRDRKVGTFPVWRESMRSVTLRLPLSKVNTGGKKRLTYRWFVKTLFTSTNCRKVCIDRAPNKNAVTESNGKPSPPTSASDTEDSGPTESPAETPTPDSTESPEVTPEATPTP